MKYATFTLAATLALFSSAQAGQITKPGSNHLAFPLASFPFAFESDSAESAFESAAKTVGQTQGLTLALAPISAPETLIPLAEFNSTGGYEGTVTLPVDVKSGHYYLIANETATGTDGATYNIHKQTLYVL